MCARDGGRGSHQRVCLAAREETATRKNAGWRRSGSGLDPSLGSRLGSFGSGLSFGQRSMRVRPIAAEAVAYATWGGAWGERWSARLAIGWVAS